MNTNAYYPPLSFHENNSKLKVDQNSLERNLSVLKGTCCLRNSLQNNINPNRSSSTSLPSNLLFPINQNSLNCIRNPPFGCFEPTCELYDIKITFGTFSTNNGTLVPPINNFNNQSEVHIRHPQTHTNTTPNYMINPSDTKRYHSFNHCEPTKHKPLNEYYSCTNPENHPYYKNTDNVVKGRWTADEDRVLCEQVALHGERKWPQVAKMVNGRIAKQCRERWYGHLKPNIKKDVWSEEEEIIFIKVHSKIGNKWAEIAKKLPGRTENTIKNHWYATKRKQISKRKGRSKYPMQSSILQDYIESLNLTSVNDDCREKPSSTTSTTNNNTDNKFSVLNNNDTSKSSN